MAVRCDRFGPVLAVDLLLFTIVILLFAIFIHNDIDLLRSSPVVPGLIYFQLTLVRLILFYLFGNVYLR